MDSLAPIGRPNDSPENSVLASGFLNSLRLVWPRGLCLVLCSSDEAVTPFGPGPWFDPHPDKLPKERVAFSPNQPSGGGIRSSAGSDSTRDEWSIGPFGPPCIERDNCRF